MFESLICAHKLHTRAVTPCVDLRYSPRETACMRKEYHQLVDFISNGMIPRNPTGFTVDPFTLQAPTFDDSILPDIYYVSKQGHERVFAAIPSCEEVRNWIADNHEWLCISGNFIGFWEHREQLYLDITNAVHGRKQALSYAKQNRQLAILHPYTQEEILTGYDEGARLFTATGLGRRCIA